MLESVILVRSRCLQDLFDPKYMQDLQSLYNFFLLDQAKAEIRGRHNNKKFGQLDLIFNLISLLSAVLFSYFFGVNGYIFSLCLSPFVVLLFHRFKFSFSKKIFADFTQKEFWRFSISMALIINCRTVF